MAASDDVRDWESALQHDGRVEVGYRRGKTLALAVVGVLFTAGGVAVAAGADTGGDRATGILGALFFGAVSVVLLRRTARARVAVVVTAGGVASPVQAWTLPWEHAYGAFVFRSRGTAIVCIAVEPAWMEQYLAAARRTRRVVAQGNRRLLGLDALSLPTPLAVDADAFAGWLSTKALARPPEPA